MNETYQEYINRVAPMTLKATHQLQLSNMQKSAKFEQGKPVAFPGYTIMTPTYADDPENREFYQQIQTCQEQLMQGIEPGLVIPVPPSSFHLTVADLIWESNYLAGVQENPDFEATLRQEVDKSFGEYQKNTAIQHPIEFQLLGVTIFPRALTICLATKTEEDYQQITQLRQSIYQNSTLIALGVQQQYPFTAHITIGYFGEIVSLAESVAGKYWEGLLTTLAKINEQLIDTEPPTLKIEKIQLSKFDDMTKYYRAADWPEIIWT